MTIDRQTVEHVASLARLELTAAETEKFSQDLSNILAMVEEINQLDLDNVHVDLDVDAPTVFRKDEGVRTFTRDELLANAPREEDGCFRVPQIMSAS